MDSDQDVRVEHVQPGKVVVTLLGEYDVATSDSTDALLMSLLAEKELVVVNLSEATFIDSSIINVLYRADRTAREQGRSFRLQLGTAAIVERALEISGVLDQIPCATSREEALE